MATMTKLYEYRSNRINQITPKTTVREKTSNKQYLRNYYLKDFKYISPDILNVKEKKRNSAKQSGVKGKLTCHLLLKIWFKQLMDGLKQFLYEGSLHGVKILLFPRLLGIPIIVDHFFRYIFEPTFSRKERATWIVIVVVSIAICTGVIIQLFSKSSSSPYVNVLDSLPTPVWAVPFPSLVLCPHLHVQLSYANVTELDSLHKFFASRICPQMFGDNIAMEKRLNADENRMLQDFIVKGSPKCTDIVKTCNWRGTNTQTKWMTTECCQNYFKPILTNYGLCFTFNGLPLNGLTNVTIPWQKTFSQYVAPGSLQWGLDTGYPKIFPPDPTMLPFRVMASGEANGLGVELYLNNSEHQSACDGSNLGFNLLISSPTDHVYTSTVLRIPMDRMTAIEVYPLTYKTDNNLRHLSPERRQCFFQDERKLVYYDFYTDSNCKHDLLIGEAVRLCNCVLFNWPRRNLWEPVCSTITDFECIDEVKAKVEEQLMYAYYEDSEEQRGPRQTSTLLSCHPSCNDVLYSSQVFYSDLVRDPGESPEWGHPNVGEITRINVHFYDDMFLGQHRHAQYDDYYFVGAIGGLLSLFLGFSIISVAEIVYFVILKPVHAVLKEIFCGLH